MRYQRHDTSHNRDEIDSGRSILEEHISTLFSSTGKERLHLQGCKVTSWSGESVEIGKKLAISSEECKYLTVTLQGITLIGTKLEIGRGRIPMKLIPSSEDEMLDLWVPMKHISSKERMGWVFLSVGYQSLQES